MRILCLLLSLFAVAACGRADAATTDLPALTVDYVQADSARVIARWARPCDAKGCADSYRVTWAVGVTTRTVRTTSALADTLWLPRPAAGDSLVATIAVTSVRRTLNGATRTASATLITPDTPPPAVDSLRTDTLSYEAALLDSFPVIAVRDTLGRSAGMYAVGEGTVLCALGRSRYTGEIRLFVPAEAPPEADAYLDQVCTRARDSYASERAG